MQLFYVNFCHLPEAALAQKQKQDSRELRCQEESARVLLPGAARS